MSEPDVNDAWDCHVHVFDAAAPVKPGHYQPAHRPLEAIEALAAAHGVQHLVLVQPSVYGTDNTLMLTALERHAGRHRGVVVVDETVSEAELDRCHAAGVRGVRFNLVSPAGHAGDPGPTLMALAPRLRARGWHVQWYARPQQLAQLVTWQRQCGLGFVLDHLAGLGATLPDDNTAWQAAAELAAAGAWIKLSGWYRLDAAEPYAALRPHIRRATALFGARCVWGSDWPHTSFAPDHLPAYASMRAPLADALDADTVRNLLTHQARVLYQFP